jgi:hypothetical protein
MTVTGVTALVCMVGMVCMVGLMVTGVPTHTLILRCW